MKVSRGIVPQSQMPRKGIWLPVLCCFGWMMGASGLEAHAATITVCSDGCDYTIIQTAITNATAGDVIDVQDATHTEAGITVNKNLTIQGQGAGSTTVQAAASEGTASDRVFAISSGTTVTIQDMTVRYGKVTGEPARGGGIYNEGTLTLTGMTVTNCQAIGATDTAAAAYGGGIYSTNSLTLTNMTVSNNRATGDDSFSSVNGGHAYGGGIYSDGTGNLTDTTVSGNTATGGDEVLNVSTAGSAYGGGIYNATGRTVTMTRVNVVNNDADGGDAGINAASGGSAYGGGLYNDGTAEIAESTFSGNEALGGFDIISFSGNGGNAHGGGIFNNTGDTLEISKSTISGNTAQGGDDIILVAGSAKGGGIYQDGSGDLDLQNVTISGNEALRGEGGPNGTGNGGGLWGTNGFYVTNCTVGNNVAEDDGGGFFSNAGSGLGPWIKNSIFGDNTAGSDGHDLYGNFRSDDYNLIENNSGYTLTEYTDNNIVGQDPLLGVLGDYGGSTQTRLLCKSTDPRDSGACNGVAAGDSPAINVIGPMEGKCGFSPPYDVDQRGVTRPYSTNCDIGAYERTGSTLVELGSFTARGFEDHVLLTWETASEIDNAGFRLWRKGGKADSYIQITRNLIPAQGGPAWGAVYEYADYETAPGVTCSYRLEDLDTSGLSTFHGPVEAWPGVVNIQVNELDGPLVVSPDDPVSVTVAMQAGDIEGAFAECWIAACTPFGWYTYANGWLPGIHPAGVFPLDDLGPLTLLNMPLPYGAYTFHVATDDQINGKPELTWMDSVDVTVK